MYGRALGGVQRVQGPQEDDEEAGSATRDILERPEGGGERSEVWELWGKATKDSDSTGQENERVHSTPGRRVHEVWEEFAVHEM